MYVCIILEFCNFVLKFAFSSDELQYFICTCTLATESTAPAESIDLVRRSDSNDASVQTLVGQLVSDIKYVRNLQGVNVAYFVFGDITGRTAGRYRLRFVLAEACAMIAVSSFLSPI